MNEILIEKIEKYFTKRHENGNEIFHYHGPVPSGYASLPEDLLNVEIKIDKLFFSVNVSSILSQDTAALIKLRLIDIIKEYCIENGIVLYNKEDGFTLINLSEVIAITEKIIPMQLN